MTIDRWMLAIAVVCSAYGCGGGRSKDPKVALAIALGQDLGCMPDETEYTPEPGPGGATRYHVMCSGQRAIYLIQDGEAVMEAPASDNKHVRQIAAKASFSFQCHPGKVTVTSADEGKEFGGTLLPTRAIAKGCDQEATFVYEGREFVQEGASPSKE